MFLLYYVTPPVTLTFQKFPGNCHTRDMPMLNYSEPSKLYYDNYTEEVPPFTLMVYLCKAGFYRNPDVYDHATCFETKWQIEGDPCGRMYLIFFQ